MGSAVRNISAVHISIDLTDTRKLTERTTFGIMNPAASDFHDSPRILPMILTIIFSDDPVHEFSSFVCVLASII